MSAVLFFIGAIGVITGAAGVIVLRDPFYSVLALVVHLISLAILFLLLRAQFVAAVQVVVYAGAVMVLYVFVVAYVGEESQSIGESLGASGPTGSRLRQGAALVGVALVAELLIALLGTGLKAIAGHGAAFSVAAPGHGYTYGTPGYIGNLLLTRFLLVFEISSFLLLIAAVGAVVLAGRRGGVDDEDTQGIPGSPHPRSFPRPADTGTMAEGVGTFSGHQGTSATPVGTPGRSAGPLTVGAGGSGGR